MQQGNSSKGYGLEVYFIASSMEQVTKIYNIECGFFGSQLPHKPLCFTQDS